jgi:nitrogen-specific signal transduction histidine kinase
MEFNMSTKKEISRLKEELLKAHKNIETLARIKSDFVSIISHELRTPLTSIKESVSLVLDGVAGPLSENQKEFLLISKNNIDRLTGIITDILDFSKLESGRVTMHKRKTDINEIIKDLYSTVKPSVERKSLGFEMDLSENMAEAWFDPERISQALNNLVSNAVKFNKEKGKIKISSSMDHLDGREFVKVVVEDTGIGISDDEKRGLFENFSPLDSGLTRTSSGVGLGLAISKHIISLHGGDIWAESEKDTGSRFIFTLPVYKKDDEFNFLLDEAIERAKQNNMNLALIVFGAKRLHDRSEDILSRTESILQCIVRGPEDKITRYKEGKLIAVIAGTDRAGAMKIVERFREKTIAPMNFGLSVYPDEDDKDKLADKAEKDMKSGKNPI